MRGQVLTYLLLAWLLLAVSQLQGSQINVRATESVPTVHFKLRPRGPKPSSRARNAVPISVEMKRIHKSPSGPNPVGNQRPPSKQ